MFPLRCLELICGLICRLVIANIRILLIANLASFITIRTTKMKIPLTVIVDILDRKKLMVRRPLGDAVMAGQLAGRWKLRRCRWWKTLNLASLTLNPTKRRLSVLLGRKGKMATGTLVRRIWIVTSYLK